MIESIHSFISLIISPYDRLIISLFSVLFQGKIGGEWMGNNVFVLLELLKWTFV